MVRQEDFYHFHVCMLNIKLQLAIHVYKKCENDNAVFYRGVNVYYLLAGTSC